ncbi:MAG: transporter [Syntrophaceae bacterium]|nr:transporter [Deltaproteobacteria bacterium]
MKRCVPIRGFVLLFAILFLNVTQARAEFFEATIPQGIWIETWAKHIAADDLKDSDGNTVKIGGQDLGLDVNLLLIRPIYATKYWIFDAWIPLVDQEIDAFGVDDSGIGDIWVSAWIRNENAPAAWRPFDINLAPGIEVKIPTNTDVSDKQYDVRADLRFSKFFFKGSPFGGGSKVAIEGAVDYTFRFEDTDTDMKPGNEFHWMVGPSIAVGNSARLGMDIGGVYTEKDEFDGDALPGTWSRSWYAGPTACINLSRSFQLRAKAAFDIDAVNKEKAQSAYLRLVYYVPTK